MKDLNHKWTVTEYHFRLSPGLWVDLRTRLPLGDESRKCISCKNVMRPPSYGSPDLYECSCGKTWKDEDLEPRAPLWRWSLSSWRTTPIASGDDFDTAADAAKAAACWMGENLTLSPGALEAFRGLS